jgi:hypothetical protein
MTKHISLPKIQQLEELGAGRYMIEDETGRGLGTLHPTVTGCQNYL